MVTQSEVMRFLKMSVWQKDRLRQEDPQKYQELWEASKKHFNPESDPEAASELAKK